MECDERNSSVYQDEIKTLLRRLKIQERRQQVDQSRVYVDTESIKRTVSDELREAYERYITLRRRRSRSISVDDFRTALRGATDAPDGELVALKVPQEEELDALAASITETSTFEEFVDRVIDRFGSILDDHLAVIRNKITTDAKSRGGDLFEALLTDIEQLGSPLAVGDLAHAIRTARTE